ncbi:S1C family serine protease [Deinococcus cellulosilyticus]|uniref:Serine protease n=1 Tax=Deinococcus cellulosilyticus (strain DSM 18568 / NBRC 106333 / KACC 11606 / 5516J-15) TaxID=1223518 RepID=A0A511N2L5_DEIC1|nr:S1C family serine protease [Deinococcus cellulosilyticus]GEM47083.1 serine protease [Deinococcus cellulosilyticus NBRC 106333 = KACC 11606]
MRGCLTLVVVLGVLLLMFPKATEQVRDVLVKPPEPVVLKNASEEDKLYQMVRAATFKIERDVSDGVVVGTGFFINQDGYALTAYHVVEFRNQVTVVLPNLRRYTADVVGFDNTTDLALLKVRINKATFLPLAPKHPNVGDSILAVGNSGGDFLKRRVGKVIDLNVAASRADFPPGTLEMRAPIAPGDSGGPVANAKGEIVGVVSYIRVYDDQSTTAYAVPMNQEQKILSELMAGTKRDVPVLGVRSSFHASDFDHGVRVGSVEKGSPAEKAGLRAEREETVRLQDGSSERVLKADYILAVDGAPVNTFDELIGVVRRKSIGDVVKLQVERDGKRLILPVQLGARATVFTE